MSISIWHAIGNQLKHPNGLAGRLAGGVMRVVNDRPNSLAVDALRIEPIDTVLELGFGPGHGIELMARRASAGFVYGIDQSTTMLRQAERRNRKAIREGRVLLYRSDFDQLPFDDASIDRILAVNVIYFWSDTRRTLDEVRRVLRPGGRVSIYATDAISMRYWKFAGSETHRLLSAAELEVTLRQGGFVGSRISVTSVAMPYEVQGLIATISEVE
jgi:ubiquinone/menaquinone biosynthesis C-methylase UbiE